MNYSAEPTSPADAPAIAAIEASASSTRWSARSVAETLAQPSTRGWIVRSDGEIVGHLLTRSAAFSAEILTIAVLPPFRRSGRAEALLATSEAAWSDEGIEEAFLEVRASNVAALSLYRGRGWEEVGQRVGYYSDGEDAVVMRWEPPRCG